MKYFNITLVISILLFIVSCQKESDLALEMSEADEIAIDGMEESYENEKLYNDSLIWCNDTVNNCTLVFKEYCDSISLSRRSIRLSPQ